MKKNNKLLLVSILALAFVLRLAAMFGDPLPHDDVFTMRCATASSWSETVRITAEDTHPPLYYLMVRTLFVVTPDHLNVARFLSVMMSIAAIFVTYLLARHFFDERTALLAVAIYALTPFNIYWAHMARNHQLLVLVGSLSFLFLFCHLRHRRKSELVWYLAMLVLVIQTNYMGFMILGTQTLIILCHEWREGGGLAAAWRRAWKPLTAQFLALLTILPWMAILLDQVATGPMQRQQFETPISIITPIFLAVFGPMDFYRGSVLLYVLFPGMLLFVPIIYANFKRLKHPEFLLFVFIPVFLPVLIAKFGQLSLALRHFAYTVPATMIFVAYGLVETYQWLCSLKRDEESSDTSL